MRKTLLLITILLVASLTACTVTNPTGDVADNCRTKEEPYPFIEKYEVLLSYRVLGVDRDSPQLPPVVSLDVQLQNTDTDFGTFTVVATFSTMEGEEVEKVQEQKFIRPGSNENFHFECQGSLGQDLNVEYEVIPSTKTITRQGTKIRTVEICD